MRLFGLTGGIASGKSTVTRMLRELGAEVLDADVIAREVVAPGTPGLSEVAARFPGVLAPDGGLDRAQLAARIFQNPEDRAALNGILHPRIAAAFAEHTQALAARGVPEVFYDAPLLIENQLHLGMDGVLLVWAPPEVQRARLILRDGLSPEAAEARIASQLPLEEKRRHATWEVDNGRSLDATHEQVARIWETIRARR